jgi:hypothetical protein
MYTINSKCCEDGSGLIFFNEEYQLWRMYNYELGIDLIYDEKGNLPVLNENLNKIRHTTGTNNINYCPWCGVKL